MSPWVSAVPAVGVVLALLGVGYFRGPTLDASVFAVIADGLLAGDVPYRDLFDHKPPGIYVAEALVGGVLPSLDPWTRAWLLTAAASVTTLAVLGRVLTPAFGTLPTLLGLLAVAPILGADLFALGGGYTEPVAILPATIGAFAALDGGSRGRALAGGALLGVAGIISFQLATAAGATIVTLVARRRLVDAIWVISGALAVGVLTAVSIAAVGAWAAAIDALVTYNRAYVAHNSLVDGLPLVALSRSAAVSSPAVALVVFWVMAIRRHAPSQIEWLSAMWLLLGAAYVVLQQNFFPHYLIAAAPAVAILASAGARRLPRLTAAPRSRVASLPAILIVGPMIVGIAVTERPLGRPDQVVNTAALIEQSSVPGDRIWVWGNEPELYLLSERRPANRFSYLFPLIQRGYSSESLVQTTLVELSVDPPVLIVDAADHPERVSFPALLKPHTRAGHVMVDGGLLDPLRSWVRANYVELAQDGSWTVYRVNRGGPG